MFYCFMFTLGVLALAGLVVAIWVLPARTTAAQTNTLGMGETGTQSAAGCPLYRRHFDAGFQAMWHDIRQASVGHGRASAAPRDVTYADYRLDPDAYAWRTILLNQASFVNGTVRIRSPGLFKLTENVAFRGGNLSLPDYAGSAYVLGFFAAITIESANVNLDLGGFTLEQERVHAAVEQRFFAVIELGASPFIDGQGPADFVGAGLHYRPAVDRLIIENGRLGRSSHHGMHGNGGTNVLLRNLQFNDYEVAAVALNGFTDVLIDNVKAHGTFLGVETLGTLSNAQFALPAAQRVLQLIAPTQPSVATRLANAIQRLQLHVDEARADITAHGEINPHTHSEAYTTFANPTGAVDGNAYSLLLHPLGVAVGAFWHGSTPASDKRDAHQRLVGNERIVVRNSDFLRTRADIVEVVALIDPAGKLVRGPFGDLLRLVDNAPPPSDATALPSASVADGTLGDGAYRGTSLTDLQLTLIDACAVLAANAAIAETTVEDVCGTSFGVGDAWLHRWARGTASLAQLVETHGYSYQRNGDTMFHVNKGVTAVRIDGGRDICLDSVVINHVHNGGGGGLVTRLPGEASDVVASYTNGVDGGHPDQARGLGYMGADARGVSIAASHGVWLDNVTVSNVHARLGNARGIDLFNHANQTHFRGTVHVTNVTTLVDDAEAVLIGEYTNGPRVGQAIGLRATSTSARTTYGSGCVFARAIGSRVLEQSLERAVDSSHDYVDPSLPTLATSNSYRS